MAVNFSTLVYSPNFEFWRRAITVTPLASQPGASAYFNYGIYNTQRTVVETDFGHAVLSDHETIVDVLEADFVVVPRQGDLIEIPAYQTLPAVGKFEVTEATTNGGGETTLVLRKLEIAEPQLVGFVEAP